MYMCIRAACTHNNCPDLRGSTMPSATCARALPAAVCSSRLTVRREAALTPRRSAAQLATPAAAV